MKSELFLLKDLFISRKLLSLPEVMKTIGSICRMTAARKLSKLNSISSYTARGAYYTIPSIPDFDTNGLWHHNCIYFSRYGTLSNTIVQLVKKSSMGYSSTELDKIVHTRTANSLTKLAKENILLRTQLNNKYLYLWPADADKQLLARKKDLQNKIIEENKTLGSKQPLKLFLSILNEKQRRIFLGYESLRLGNGGDMAIALLTGANIKTVAKGRRELLEGDITIERIRKVGGGRHPLKKTKS